MSIHVIKGREYVYKNYRDSNGKVRSCYIGPKDEFDRGKLSKDTTNRLIEYNIVRHRPDLSPKTIIPNLSLAFNFDKIAKVMESAIPA